MTGIEYDICRTQQDLYEYAAKQKYDMCLFSDNTIDEEQAAEIILEEKKIKTRNKD